MDQTPQPRNRNAAKVLVGGIVLLGLLAAIVTPFLSLRHEGEPPERINCAGHLKNIGLALQMYANDHGGYLPPDLYDIVGQDYLNVPEMFGCANVKRKYPKKFTDRTQFVTDYEYLYCPALRWDGPEAGTTPVVRDKDGNHPGFGHVLFADCRVRCLAGGDWPFRQGTITPNQDGK